MGFPDPSSLAPAVRDIAREAGAMAARFFRRGEKTTARIWSKAGGSPVTEADVAVDAFLKVQLNRLLPQAGWLSEETADDPARLRDAMVWIVDPIDGTRAFLTGHPDWSVAIALLAGGRPVLGMVHAPAHRAHYEAVAGGGATRDGQSLAASPAQAIRNARVAGAKSLVDHLERSAGPITRMERIPSLALRLVRVAEGAVDLGLVSANARDWDIAAADLILREAGARLSDFRGEDPAYNRPDPVHGELLAAPRQLHPRLIEAMTAQARAR
jgi:myo-inositol-1(or 4)-monophosphatase